jgi:hypothetical protein
MSVYGGNDNSPVPAMLRIWGVRLRRLFEFAGGGFFPAERHEEAARGMD